MVVTEKVGPPKPTLQVAETAPKNVEAKKTPVAEEVVDLKEVMKSKPNVSGSSTNPGIVVDDELCSNDSFEAQAPLFLNVVQLQLLLLLQLEN